MAADRLIIGSAGNISVRLDEQHIIVTPAGVVYEKLSPAELPVVDLRDGSYTGPLKPTSEIALHIVLHNQLPNITAVVHTHSLHAAACAVAGRNLPFICNESLAMRAEEVRVTAYAPPGDADLGKHALETFRQQPGSRAVLLANHGVVAVGSTLDDAYLVAAQVEWTAEIFYLASTLGSVNVLSEEIQDAIARNYGVTINRSTKP